MAIGNGTIVVLTHKATNTASTCHGSCRITFLDVVAVIVPHQSADIATRTCHRTCSVAVGDVSNIITHQSTDTIKSCYINICQPYMPHSADTANRTEKAHIIG